MMNDTAILLPMIGLAWWTAGVYLIAVRRRLRGAQTLGLRMESYNLGEPDSTPAYVRQANRNILNLFEMPVLYYFTGTLLFVTDNVSETALALAWAYFVLRIAHSLIHLTYNRVLHRSIVFAASAVAGLLMLAELTVALLSN